MAQLKILYIALRQQPDGSIRPRFVPGPRERALGYKGADLRHDEGPKAGQWFTLDEARAWSVAKRAEIMALRASGKRLRMPPRPRGRTVEDLLEAFLGSGKFKRPRDQGGYAPGTFDDYRAKANLIIWQPQSVEDRRAGAPRDKEPFALTPAKDVTPAMLYNDEEGGFFGYMQRSRGQSTARNCAMVLSSAYKWARKASDWQLADNPCTQLGLKKPKVGEAITYTIEEFNAFVAMADHPDVAEHELADAAFIALFSGQRPADVIAYDGAGTSDGVTRLVQSKRGRRVEVEALPPLTDRLAQMAERRTARGYLCAELIVDSRTGRGFNQNTFEHRMRAHVDRVARGDAALGLAPCPSIAGKSFKHFRKTLLTWAKRAGASDVEFAAVSGHALPSLPQVMPHYYTPGSEEAASAMAKVWAYMQQKGMKVG